MLILNEKFIYNLIKPFLPSRDQQLKVILQPIVVFTLYMFVISIFQYLVNFAFDNLTKIWKTRIP